MTRAIALALTLSACSAQATQPAPCVATEPAPATIDLHDGMSATEAGLREFYGRDLDGGTE